MVTERDYDMEAVAASRSVLAEIMHVLGEYRKDIVLVGGWVPAFICPGATEHHVGSKDVDLAINHRNITNDKYSTIQKLLLERGYAQGEQPYSFFRSVNVSNSLIRVEVDFLAGEYGGTGRSHRTQRIQNMRIRKARGADLVFKSPIEMSLSETLPDGGKDSVTIRVAGVAPFLVMKMMALADRLKEKDAWDICYCLRNYPGGVDAVAEAFMPHLKNKLVSDGLDRLGRIFASVTSMGPSHVSAFEEIGDAEERARIQRDAFERVNYLIEKLNVK